MQNIIVIEKELWDKKWGEFRNSKQKAQHNESLRKKFGPVNNKKF